MIIIFLTFQWNDNNNQLPCDDQDMAMSSTTPGEVDMDMEVDMVRSHPQSKTNEKLMKTPSNPQFSPFGPIKCREKTLINTKFLNSKVCFGGPRSY